MVVFGMWAEPDLHFLNFPHFGEGWDRGGRAPPYFCIDVALSVVHHIAMDHAIELLKRALVTATNNEPIQRAEGRIEDADLRLAEIEDYSTAINGLRYLIHLREYKLMEEELDAVRNIASEFKMRFVHGTRSLDNPPQSDTLPS